jgi:peptide/nickel transport system substrate-binding protein
MPPTGGRFSQRWSAGSVFLLAALLLAMAACGARDQAAESPPVELRAGTPMQVHQANPLADYGYNILAMLATHDTLVRFDAGMRPVAQLATSWQVNADATEWQFDLRSDARWHDGQPVTVEDVKFTFEYLAAHHPASAWIADLVRAISTEGTRIVFRLKRPYSRFLINGGFIVRILPRHVWQSVNDPLRPGSTPVTIGSGPFVFETFDPRTGQLSFRRNPAYYGSTGAVENLRFYLNRSFDHLVLALERGDIDVFYKYASGFPPAYRPRLARAMNIQHLEVEAMGVPAALGFNLRRTPMRDPAWRKAIALAMDYPRLGQSLLQTQARIPGAGFVPPAFDFAVRLPELVYSPGKSRHLLTSAGYRDTDADGLLNRPDGANLKLTLLARSDLEGTDGLLPILNHNFEQVGIGLEIERADLSTWIARMQEDRYDLVLFRTTPWGMMMEAGCASGYFDARRHGGGTLANVDDPAFYDLCDAVLRTPDPLEQQRLHHAMQRYYAEHLPAVALCWAAAHYPATNRWQGWQVNPIEGGLVNRQTFCRLQPAGTDGQYGKTP